MRTLLALALVVGGTGLFAQDSATATGTALANVIAPLTLTHVQGAALNLGGFFTGKEGYVVVECDGSRWTYGDVIVRTAEPGKADNFAMTGDPRYTITPVLDNYGSLTLTNANGATLWGAIYDMQCNGASYWWGPWTVDGTGKGDIKVGGYVYSYADQATGNYAGTYNLTVAYN
jgi:hypothetical protein